VSKVVSGASVKARGVEIRSRGGVRRIRRATSWAILAILAMSTIYPFVFITLTAFRYTTDFNLDQAGLSPLTTDNLVKAWNEAHVSTYAVNSVIVVVPSVILLAVLSTLAAFALVHTHLPFRRIALVVLVGLMVLPPSVLIIPTFEVVLLLGLFNSNLGLILVYVALFISFDIFLAASYMRGIPKELLDAASVDGAGELRQFVSVVLPLMWPGILTIVTLNFLTLWNEFLYSSAILQSGDSRTVVVGVAATRGTYLNDIPYLAAGLFVVMIPPLVIFLMFQREVARGVTGGAVK